eukprot:gnl/Dysnectes_brevis/2383_a2818_1393.p1 GENE.gnl/Dysnectes_brevis/2383_a2818_1393~~gnl/Dysnectes_brevis/2383_a2818_1393.p1  ORF type:complete len:230 (-),score=59.25 gnl/Dysnectes_brevis/2383_a2818_1393:615-1304(-)
MPDFEAEETNKQAMYEDQVILVDEDDNEVGSASKLDSHLNGGMLHRAFSVLLLDDKGNMLLQKRADSKITFPGYWSNTCCSHPLASLGETGGVPGVLRAASRRLEQEMGITKPASELSFAGTLLYTAPSPAHGHGTAKGMVFRERELDYVVLGYEPSPVINLNPREVEAVQWLSPSGIRAMWGDLSPWFQYMLEGGLMGLWEEIAGASSVESGISEAIRHPFKLNTLGE